MRKLNVLTLLASFFLLVGCTNSKSNTSSSDSIDESIESEDPIKMEKDDSPDYVIEDSSNINGSASYELFVRSFYDHDGNGKGDFLGVKEKIPYLAKLGIKTVWLMPIFPSPTYHGYDITDYYNVNSDFGTLADFDAMVEEADKYHIDIMLDMVFNHCSKKHDWFTQAQADYSSDYDGEDSKKDWFVFNGSSMSYEARFDSSMPDFNLDCQGVRDEMENITKFWIDHGVKGFRLDAVLYYYYNNTAQNVAFMNWLVETAHKYDPNFYFVGECWASDAIVNSYYESNINSFFRFGNSTSGGETSMINFMKGKGRSSVLLNNIQKNEENMKKKHATSYSSYFLSNHDQDRVSHNFDEMQYKCAASFYMLLPGTPFMYYGEEIAMKGKRKTSPDDYSDVRRRLPMVWSKDNKTGECEFPEKNRQDLNKNNNQVELGADDLENQAFSLLKHYQRVISIRNKYDVFKNGVFTSLYDQLNTEDTAVYAFKIQDDDESVIIVHNANANNIEVTAPGTEILDTINTSHRIPKLEGNKLTLGAYSTVVMK